MHHETIYIESEKDAQVYIHPQRQKILRMLHLSPDGLTAKQIADQLGIVPSSAGHHLRQLAKIGVVYPSHTESINGFKAQYYKASDATVSFSRAPSKIHDERQLLFQSTIQTLLNEYFTFLNSLPPQTLENDSIVTHGDVMTGTLFLTQEEARTMCTAMKAFLHTHQRAYHADAIYEYALILSPHRENPS